MSKHSSRLRDAVDDLKSPRVGNSLLVRSVGRHNHLSACLRKSRRKPSRSTGPVTKTMLRQTGCQEVSIMDMNQRKEQFSRAYVLAVAATAGYAWYQPS